MAASVGTEKETNSKQVSIHIREDSDSELQALFDIPLKGGQRPLQVPMRMRNFPPSFWQPPVLGSKSPSVHSRENSLDNSCGPFSPDPVASPQPPVGHHSRANSCPANLGQTLAVSLQHQNHALQNHHLRQQSYDVGGGGDDLGPLPPGWEMAKAPNGQIYFMNHITKSTQWEDPRKAIQQQMLNQLNGTASPRSSAVSSPVPNGQGGVDLGPLPQGWEQSATPEGEMYFIHHLTKRTTWYDPRIPIHAQQVPLKQRQESTHAQAQKLQQEARLRRLENERRVLQQKRAELNQFITRQQQEREIQQSVTQTQEMMMRHTLSEGGTKLDPFLAQTNGDPHIRQESADSGLGMGSFPNLGTISEDMGMENMDTDLDTTLTDTNQQIQIQQQQGMDTEELIPTLPELGEELSRDFINTIFNTNTPVENELTWL